MLKCNIDIKALVWSSYRLYFDGGHPAGEQVVAHSRSEHNQLFRKLHHTFSLHLHILYSHCTIFQLEHGLGGCIARTASLPPRRRCLLINCLPAPGTAPTGMGRG